MFVTVVNCDGPKHVATFKGYYGSMYRCISFSMSPVVIEHSPLSLKRYTYNNKPMILTRSLSHERLAYRAFLTSCATKLYLYTVCNAGYIDVEMYRQLVVLISTDVLYNWENELTSMLP